MFFIIFIIVAIFFAYPLLTTSKKRYLIMRHSERVDAVNPEWANTAERPYDTPITDNMKFFNSNIKKYDMNFFKGAKIYCSPFKRCIQTSKLISDLFNPPLQICLEPALIEVSSMEFYLYPSSFSSFSQGEKGSEKGGEKGGEKDNYFTNEAIFKRHKNVNFDRNYKPYLTKYDIGLFFKSNPAFEDLQKKMIDFLHTKDSCICVAHREFINIIGPDIPDNYCGSALVDENLRVQKM